jgi:ribulose-5-phosphate 4-epimerase/fuculose-1-phosphate aldolase
MSALPEARAATSQGSRILAVQGVLDAFGHLSCRSPERSDRFLIPRSLAPGLVTPDDVVELDLAGDLVSPVPGVQLFLERFIHGEIYRRRPDVQAVVHSHALPVVPFTVVPGARLRPICHMCGFLRGTPTTFDVAAHVGPSTDLLIRNSELGRDLAEHLGDASVVLMRSHGYTVAGASVQEAVFQAIYTMKNCEIELSARVLGEPAFLSAGEADASARTLSLATGRAWELWLRQCPPIEAVTGKQPPVERRPANPG